MTPAATHAVRDSATMLRRNLRRSARCPASAAATIAMPVVSCSCSSASSARRLIALVLVVAVALLLGYRPSATPIEWAAAFGLLTLMGIAIIWLAVGMGLSTKSAESASNLPLLMLPFLGSGFVPTDSLPPAMRWFAEYQPFTPMMETLRGLLSGTAIGGHAVAAVAWSVAIGLLGYLWARHLYDRDRTP